MSSERCCASSCVMTCERPFSAASTSSGAAECRSCVSRSAYLFDQIGREDQHFCVFREAKCRGEVADMLHMVLGRGHRLEHAKRRALYLVTEHAEVGELEHCFRLDVHVGAFHLGADFVQHTGNVLRLILAAVRAQPLDERRERLFEHRPRPGRRCEAKRARRARGNVEVDGRAPIRI